MPKLPLSLRPTIVSPLLQHIHAWTNCTRCDLHLHRRQVVHCRGHIPCDVMFVGEAPGASEDSLGTPFEGPAGQLLNFILKQAFSQRPELKFGIANVVGCIPDKSGENHAPPEEAIIACKPRIEGLIVLANPKLVIAVGTIARDLLKPGFKRSIKLPQSVGLSAITHPAAILRSSIVSRNLDIQREIVRVRNALKEVFGEIDP